MLGRRLFTVVSALVAFTTSTSYAVLTDWEKIHSVVHSFPMYIDSKDFSNLNHVFTKDATANYTGKLSNLKNLKEIQKALKNDTHGVVTQHLLGTTLIDIKPHYVHPSSGHYRNTSHDSACGKANSTTYVQVMRFGQPYQQHGGHVTLYGKYLDKFEKVGVSEWRICHRQWEFHGPGFMGNRTLLGLIGQPNGGK